MSKNFSLKIQHFVTKELNQQQVRKHASILLKPVLTNISNIGGSEKRPGRIYDRGMHL